MVPIPVAIFVITPFIVLAVLSIFWYAKWHRIFGDIKHIPGPKPYPIIGNANRFPKDPTEIFHMLHGWHLKFGNIFKGCLAFDMLLLVSEPEYLEYILMSKATIDKGAFYRYFHNWLGLGLFTSDYPKWQQRKRILTPAYNFKMLKSYIGVFERNGKTLVEKLRMEVGKASFDPKSYVTLCALDSICETAMGVSLNTQNNCNTDYIKANKEINRIIIARMVRPEKHFDLLYRFTKDYKIEKKCIEIMHNFTMSVINTRRQELLSNPESFGNSDADEFGRKSDKVFLDILLRSTMDGKPFSNEDIMEEVNTFLFGGHDTVSICMAFWLHLISKHPNVEAKLAAEQQDIFGDDRNRSSTYEDLQKMEYLEMTIKEALRLYPPGSFLMREACEDFSFRDLHVKKGTQVAIFPFYVHRRADLYPDPEKFIPERFTPENIKKRNPFAFLAFCGGYRSCVGQKFAMIELKTILSIVLRAFVIRAAVPEHNIVIKSEALLASRNGYNIKLENRIGWK